MGPVARPADAPEDGAVQPLATGGSGPGATMNNREHGIGVRSRGGGSPSAWRVVVEAKAPRGASERETEPAGSPGRSTAGTVSDDAAR